MKTQAYIGSLIILSVILLMIFGKALYEQEKAYIKQYELKMDAEAYEQELKKQRIWAEINAQH